MPVATDFQNCISDSLKKSLSAPNKNGRQKDVGQTVASSAKRSLLEKAEIKFVKAEKDANSMLQNLKNKYICLNRSHSTLTNGIAQNGLGDKDKKGFKDSCKDDGIPKPKMVLYAADKLKLTWESPRRVGAGLSNLGNTCFLNSVLQCLSYTPALANHFLSGQHKSLCRSSGFCMLCELSNHVTRALTQTGGSIKPMGILQKLKLISKHMRWGRQEDAHEFLRYVVDAMQSACLSGQSNSLEKLSKETTFMHQVFGGYLRSQVRCLQCKTTSNTYDPVLDISVDLKGTNSVEKALQKFVQPEMLDIDNAYKCARCKKKVRAVKQFTIHRAPKVLTVHLKRFDYHRLMGGKVGRHIEFSPKLNIRGYMSHRQGDPVNYQLYGVLVHSGYSCNSGHYYCYIRASNQTWYCMNDSSVSQTGLNNVLNSEAYILFYSMVSPTSASLPKAAVHVTGSQMLNTASTPISRDSKHLPVHTSKQQMPAKGPMLLKTPQSGTQKPSTTAGSTRPQGQTNGADGVNPATPAQPRRISLTTLNDMILEGSSVSAKAVITSAATVTVAALPAGNVRPPAINGLLNGHGPAKPTEGKKHKLVNSVTGDASSPKKSRVDPISIDTTAACQNRSAKTKQISPLKLMSPHKLTSPPRLMSPPRSKSKTLSQVCKATTPNWQVASKSGRTRYPSESGSCSSLSSTSEWTVTVTPKPLSEKTNQSSQDRDTAAGSLEKKSQKKTMYNGVLNTMETGSPTMKRKSEGNLAEGSAKKIKMSTGDHRNHSGDLKPLNESTPIQNTSSDNEAVKSQKQKIPSTDRSPSTDKPSKKGNNPFQMQQKQPTDAVSSPQIHESGPAKKKKRKRRKKKLNSVNVETNSEDNENKVEREEIDKMCNGISSDDMVGSSGDTSLNKQMSANQSAVPQDGPENNSIKKKKKKKKKKVRVEGEMGNRNVDSREIRVENAKPTEHARESCVVMESGKQKNKLNKTSDETEILNTDAHWTLQNGSRDNLPPVNEIPTQSSTKSVEINRVSNGNVKKKKKKYMEVVRENTSEEPELSDTDTALAKDRLTIAKEKMKKKRRYSEPVVKEWDAQIEDDDTAFKREAPKAPASAWDGRKDSNISFLLERHVAIKGLGSGVLTWDGQKPEINREIEREKLTDNYKDGWYDGYEQEIDQGRTKKVKLKKQKHRGNTNHFQSIQNNTNMVTQLKKEGKLPSLPSY